MYDIVNELVKTQGISGREGQIAEKIAAFIHPYTDSCYTDALGNLIALKRGVGKKKKKILLCAHMDEIGFLITFIEENGYLRAAPVGGIDFIASAYSEVILENGTRGVLVPEEEIEKKEDYKGTKFYIDIGVQSRAEAEKYAKIGDVATVAPSLFRLAGSCVAGRPLDDRIGCAVLLGIAERLGETEDDVYFVFSVQEEVGCRGAKTAAYSIAPDYSLVFDVTGTGDAIGAKPMAVKIGGGAAIKVKDNSVICHTGLVAALAQLAEEQKIPHQFEILTYGGTDTSSVQTSGMGCVAGALSIPSRNIHTAVEVADLADAEACRNLALAFIRNHKGV